MKHPTLARIFMFLLFGSGLLVASAFLPSYGTWTAIAGVVLLLAALSDVV